MKLIDLDYEAFELQQALRQNRRPGINDANELDVQALCVAEEAGECVAAYRRYFGKARRRGTLEELQDEVADVLITTSVFAIMAGINIEEAVKRKLDIIWSRGWKADG